MKKINNNSAIQYSLDWLYPWMNQQHRWSRTRFERASTELMKFMTIIKSSQKPIALPHSDVDELWHEFMVWTRQYADFCREKVGFFVHHQPNTEQFRVGFSAIRRFCRRYEARFGALADVWFERFADADLSQIRNDEQAMQALQWSGWPGI